MNDQIKQIAHRLKGLREVLDLSVADVAAVCGLTPEAYERLESGETDIPVSVLHQIGTRYEIDLSALMFGEEPRMNSYFLTRSGQGASFMNRKADPFIVTVEPSESKEIYLNTHPGQEFNYILEGRMILQIGEKQLTLNEGDSLYFDANRPHGMKALDGKRVRFLAIIL